MAVAKHVNKSVRRGAKLAVKRLHATHPRLLLRHRRKNQRAFAIVCFHQHLCSGKDCRSRHRAVRSWTYNTLPRGVHLAPARIVYEPLADSQSWWCVASALQLCDAGQVV